MATLTQSKCYAFGCSTASTKLGGMAFCTAHWRKLPEDLRGPGSVKQAVVHLAVEDGYLVKASAVKRTPINDNPGRSSDGYV